MAGPPRLSAQDAAAIAWLGLPPQVLAKPKDLELWPENQPAVDLFIVLSTQWRMGPAGAVGLDYGPVPLALSQLRLRGRQARDAFAGLQVMEAEALAWLAQQREKQQRERNHGKG